MPTSTVNPDYVGQMQGVFPSAIIGFVRDREENIAVTRLAYNPGYGGKHPASSRAILRRRILLVSIFVTSTLVWSIFRYYRSTYLGSTDWRWFWIGEMFIGAWLVAHIVQVLRRTAKLSVPQDPIDAHKWAVRNRSDLNKSDLCGCFHCLEVFPPSQIHNWIDDGETALCPKCSVASVIGSISAYPIERTFLSKMRDPAILAVAGLPSHLRFDPCSHVELPPYKNFDSSHPNYSSNPLPKAVDGSGRST